MRLYGEIFQTPPLLSCFGDQHHTTCNRQPHDKGVDDLLLLLTKVTNFSKFENTPTGKNVVSVPAHQKKQHFLYTASYHHIISPRRAHDRPTAFTRPARTTSASAEGIIRRKGNESRTAGQQQHNSTNCHIHYNHSKQFYCSWRNYTSSD